MEEYYLLKNSIEQNIDNSFSNNAKRIIEVRKNYHNRSMGFKHLGYFITKYSSEYSVDVESYPALKELLSLLNEIKKTNTTIVSVEAEKFATKIFTDKFSVSNKFQMQKLISDYKLKKIDLSTFVSSVGTIVALDNKEVKDQFVANHPHLWTFYDVQKKFNTFLDTYLPELDKSVDSFMDELIATVLTDKEEKLYSQYQLAEKINRLISLELSSAQWDDLNSSIAEIKSLLTSKSKKDLLKSVDRSREFYELAVQRNSTMFNNMYNKLQEGFDGAILLSGGFHTGAITELLEKQNLSYMVVVPKVNTIIDQQQYYSVMKSQPTPLEIQLDKFLQQTIKPPSSSEQLLDTTKKVSVLSKKSLVLTTAIMITALGLISCGINDYESPAGTCDVDFPDENLVHVTCTGTVNLDHNRQFSYIRRARQQK